MTDEKRRPVSQTPSTAAKSEDVGVYRADQDGGVGRGYMDDVQRQIVEAGYRRIVGPDDYLRWTTNPPTEGERLPTPTCRGIGPPSFR